MARTPPRFIEPQLATLVDQAPPGVDYLYELKFDGYRAIATVDHGKVRIATRTGLDWTASFGPVARALEKLKVDSAVLDGEVCYVLDDGRTDFQHLQNAMKDQGRAAQSRLAYFAFDLLFHDGDDLRKLPLRERKQRLAKLLGAAVGGASAPTGKASRKSVAAKAAPTGVVRFSQDLSGDSRVLLAQACQLGLEGLIGKRPDKPYVSGRNTDWIKLKCQRRQEFVIVGYTPPKGSRSGFGSLLLAVREGNALRYVGRVGTGFTESSLKQLLQRLAAMKTDKVPVTNPPRRKDLTWVQPKLVCEVTFTEMTRDGSLRHPSFQGLREDKPPEQVKEEKAIPGKRIAAKAAPTGKSKPVIGGVKISNPDRVMDSASGTTKLDLARYHDAVIDWIMPYAEHRPVALVRCPSGDAEACFFQKRTSRGMTAAIKHRQIAGNEVVYVTEPRGWMELVQFNAVEFHGWGARLPAYDKPDWVVFDLDPDASVPFKRVIDAARAVRERLEALDLQSFVKTTGGKGLHVVVPIAPKQDWDAVKGFAEALANLMVRQDHKTYVATMSKKKREGKIFIDWLRNGAGATAVLPYSPRARPGCAVAMPLSWDELAGLDPKAFTVATVPGLLKKRKKDPWADFIGLKQALPKRPAR
jgi:bifunctional non-homologous end joining protein LigD